MPRSGAAAETWLVGTQTPGWRAAGALAVPTGLVLGMVVEPAAQGQSNQCNENIKDEHLDLNEAPVYAVYIYMIYTA